MRGSPQRKNRGAEREEGGKTGKERIIKGTSSQQKYGEWKGSNEKMKEREGLRGS